MTTDQRERATEILHELDAIARNWDRHEYGLPIGSEVMEEMIAAVAPDIADRPESDSEPLTAEWLESIGFEKTFAPAGCAVWLKTIETEQFTDGTGWTKLRIGEAGSDGWWPVDILQGIEDREEGGVTVLVNKKTTRGDVRRLCDAIGWPLTSAENAG